MWKRVRASCAVGKFRANASEAFAFLVKEFGFQEEIVPSRKNQFSAWFANATTRVIIEGTHWGGSVRVAFGNAGLPEQFENSDLLDLASIRCPEKVPNDTQPTLGQLEMLNVLAVILRECATDVLRGDFNVASQIRDIRQRRQDEWNRQKEQRGRPRPEPPEM
jgi:hypothetical protein